MANKMTWEYRLVLRMYGEEKVLGIYEVYYINGKPSMVTETPVTIMGDKRTDIESALKLIEKGIKKPILKYEDFD